MDDAFEQGMMTGAFLRKTLDRSLGDVEPEDAFDIATGIALDPDAVSEVTGVAREHLPFVDPEAVRDGLMAEYENQRASDELANALNDSLDTHRRIVGARRAAIYRCAGADDAQIERAEFDRSNGDMSAVNAAREMFFFE